MKQKITYFYNLLVYIIKESFYIRRNFVFAVRILFTLIGFHILLIVYIFNELFVSLTLKLRILPRPVTAGIIRVFSHIYDVTVKVLDKNVEGTISRVDLIQLAIRNMKAKKTRSIITVSGMSIGIGAIVFLVSLGYGVEKLVTSRVARLDEMSQADISPQTGGKVKITDETLAKMHDIEHVKLVLPQIAIVGRVNYNNSVSDMAVYGVTSDYLKQSAIKPTKGKIFDNNQISAPVSSTISPHKDSTLEKSASLGEKVADVDFSVNSKDWKRVREEPKVNAKIIGYLKPEAESLSGEEVWGEIYQTENQGQTSKDRSLAKWIKGSFKVWQKQKCDVKEPLCSNGEYKKSMDSQLGYVSQIDTMVSYKPDAEFDEILGEQETNSSDAKIISMVQKQDGKVLGIETATASASIAADLVATDSAEIAQKAVKIDLPATATRQAVVNASMLKILGLNETDAIGKKFDASFIIVGSLLDKKDSQVESNPSAYTIIGVIPDDKTPYFYVPFVDLRGLGIGTYSQMKVVSDSQKELGQIRKKIEGLGYTTRSVADTVAQINSIFGTARLLLALLGMVALSIASLGMFNTLTVSLLERTREVGLMKAMGMKSSEVRELFLTESMIMGIFGGLFGLLTGFFMGKGLGLILSVFSVSKGAGYLDISYIPGFFISIIILLSLIVGIITGLYPARRATRISALNALRYE